MGSHGNFSLSYKFCPRGPGFGYPERGFVFLNPHWLIKMPNIKFQRSKFKNPNNLSSLKFWSLDIGIWNSFVIWCFEFVIFDTKLQNKAKGLWTPMYGGFQFNKQKKGCIMFAALKTKKAAVWMPAALNYFLENPAIRSPSGPQAARQRPPRQRWSLDAHITSR